MINFWRELSDNTKLFFATIVMVIIGFAIQIVLINWIDEDDRPITTDNGNIETTTTFELLS